MCIILYLYTNSTTFTFSKYSYIYYNVNNIDDITMSKLNSSISFDILNACDYYYNYMFE